MFCFVFPIKIILRKSYAKIKVHGNVVKLKQSVQKSYVKYRKYKLTY